MMNKQSKWGAFSFEKLHLACTVTIQIFVWNFPASTGSNVKFSSRDCQVRDKISDLMVMRFDLRIGNHYTLKSKVNLQIVCLNVGPLSTNHLFIFILTLHQTVPISVPLWITWITEYDKACYLLTNAKHCKHRYIQSSKLYIFPQF